MSNIFSLGLAPKGFSLPDGFSWDVRIYHGLKEGQAKVWDNYGSLFAELQFHNDKLNGECLIYKSGSIKEKINYVNDIANGWASECLQGEEVRWYLYKNGKKTSELIQYENLKGLWKEIDLETQSILSICHYNKQHVKIGRGFLFKNNQIVKIVTYENGEEDMVWKVFQDNIMTEYDRNGGIIYRGGYLENIEKEYPYHGEGLLLENGKRVYEGNWVSGKREGYGISLKKDRAYYEGNWKMDVPEGEGVLFDEKGKIQYKGKWENGIFEVNDHEWFDYKNAKLERKEITTPTPFPILTSIGRSMKPTESSILKPIAVPYLTKPPIYKRSPVKRILRSEMELYRLINDQELYTIITELVIEEGCGNDYRDDLRIFGFSNLRYLEVKQNSLMHINSFILSNNPQLISVTTGCMSFQYVKRVIISSILSYSINNSICHQFLQLILVICLLKNQIL